MDKAEPVIPKPEKLASGPMDPVPKGPEKQEPQATRAEPGLWSRLWKEATKSISPEVLGKWLTSLGGRRFVLSLGAGVVTSVLVWYGKITPEIYRDVILGTVGIYIAGNTFQKVKTQQ